MYTWLCENISFVKPLIFSSTVNSLMFAGFMFAFMKQNHFHGDLIFAILANINEFTVYVNNMN